jgi:Uncharacterized protein conserved in archaea
MFLESIIVVETSPCLADKEKFKAITKASVDLTELLPYLNAVIDNPNYQANSQSLVFKRGIIGYTLVGDQINITRFLNHTELHECLDWVQELINDVYESKDDITPNHKSRKILPALTIYQMLPKTNCQKCGEKTCMAFATKLNKFDAEITECQPLLEEEYTAQRKKLIQAMA